MDQPANHAANHQPEDAELRVATLELALGVESALPGWVVRSVGELHRAWAGEVPAEVSQAAEVAGRRAADEVGAELRRMADAGPDEQPTTPLGVIRDAVRFPTAVLREAGVPGVVRDAFDERHFPHDQYGLTPRTFADVDPALHEPGLRWGAARARSHLARHGHKRTLGQG
ncbi:MAG TPA: hypothetical protein VMN58_11880 [Acidimicrobiales bacterium]|nr:hypothetical protein [Acidimicrobiales bacterium]